ncbi:rod shape-determining protein MreD [Paracoccus aestuariivivens]|uniref:Rod shape-determining protein MreD n=1 Tax=Paracoccus aestuariivivens TaxID=1820333 RepID=A0A6L6J615_9RHOB|nr:rod shape-determining protein MreD [Paracoccus aestuariivivens]MTH77542.1 rod shape-determining protein MreD [Paracoccus aestuariivivens]
MIEQARRNRLAGQILFVLLFLAILFLRLMPLNPGRVVWPGPDLAMCLTLAWTLRRPEQAPVLVIALLFLLEDILLLRPLGLWAAVVVMGTEAARRREQHWRELPFMIEWLRVATLMAMMMLTYRFALALFFLPRPPLGQAILQFIATTAAYPLVVGLMRWPLGLRRGLSDSETRQR